VALLDALGWTAPRHLVPRFAVEVNKGAVRERDYPSGC
jgi:hypothetical protein